MSEYLVVDTIRDGGGIDSVRHEAICIAEAVGAARRLADQQERAERDAGTTFLTEVDIVRNGRLVSWILDGPAAALRWLFEAGDPVFRLRRAQ